MRMAIGKQVNNGIVIAVAIVLAIVGLSIWQYWRIRGSGTVVRHVDSVLYRTSDISTTFVQQELDFKNFQLTHDSSFLPKDTIPSLLEKMGDLIALTVNDPVVRSRVDTLAALFGLDEAVAGSAQRIPAILSGIDADEHRELEQRRAANLIRASELQWTLWGLFAAVVVLAVLVFRKVRVDLREARVARDQSEDKYRMLFFKSPLPKWIYDEDSLQFLEVNEAAVRMYGYSEEEFRKLTLADIRPKEDVGQWRHTRKNGELIDVEVMAHPVDVDGHRARLVTIVD